MSVPELVSRDNKVIKNVMGMTLHVVFFKKHVFQGRLNIF